MDEELRLRLLESWLNFQKDNAPDIQAVREQLDSAYCYGGWVALLVGIFFLCLGGFSSYMRKFDDIWEFAQILGFVAGVTSCVGSFVALNTTATAISVIRGVS